MAGVETRQQHGWLAHQSKQVIGKFPDPQFSGQIADVGRHGPAQTQTAFPGCCHAALRRVVASQQPQGIAAWPPVLPGGAGLSEGMEHSQIEVEGSVGIARSQIIPALVGKQGEEFAAGIQIATTDQRPG